MSRRLDGNGSDEQDSVFRASFEPDEAVLWVGRPRSIRRIVGRSLPKALIGLALMAFVLCWMGLVVLGGNNNWDQKQPAEPFAPHNVMIATLAGAWFLPPSLYLILWPLRTWWRVKRTAYALTDRRALIGEPRWPGRFRTQSFLPRDLTLMRCAERADGSGDLVLENKKTWMGWNVPVGFFEIDRVRAVESLVRDLRERSEPAPGPSPVPKRGSLGAGEKIYRLSAPIRFFQTVVPLAVGALAAFCLVGNLVLAIAALILVPSAVLHLIRTQLGDVGPLGIAASILGGLGALIGGVVAVWYSLRLVLAMPAEIAFGNAGEIEFRSWLRTTRVRVGEIQSIVTGGWTDPNHAQVTIRYEGGTFRFFNQFANFKDFLVAIKDLNPAVEIKGF